MSIQENVRRNNGTLTLLIAAVCLICSGLFATWGLPAFADEGIEPQASDTVPVYRLYNDVTSEHLYTTSQDEASTLASNYSTLNWKYEGVGWLAPSTGTPVHRLYNPGLGNHLYSSDQAEIAYLCPAWGWQDEGVLFYSGGDIPIYRLYNPFLHSLHLWTTSILEYNSLPAHQWQQENVAFYAVALGSAATDEDAHIHTWVGTSSFDIKNGRACNGCGQDLDLIADFDEHTVDHMIAGDSNGWHTHTWFLAPETQTCTTCGAKGHKHEWSWVEPVYSTGSDRVMYDGYYKCWQCGNTSKDGSAQADYIYRSDNEYGRADSFDTWMTGFNFAGTGYVVSTKSVEPPTDPLQLQFIGVGGPVSMGVGDTANLSVSYTPSNTTSDRTVTWSSNNPSVISVDQSGAITSHAEGGATITATSTSGYKASSFVRATPGNIGNVNSIKLLVNGTDASTGTINLTYGQSYPVTLVTNPGSAVYEVSYSIEGFPVLSIDGYAKAGNISSWSWENNYSFTDPSSSVFANKRGSATLIATVRDKNGNTLEARAPVNVV